MKSLSKKKHIRRHLIVLKGLRCRECYTQRQLANKLGISLYAYRRIETGSKELDESMKELLAKTFKTEKCMFE